MKRIFVFISLCISLFAQAQQKIQVLDSSSSVPVANVNITFGTAGTSTDNDGFFDMKHFSTLSEKDLLTFSCVGYTTKQISIADAKKDRIVYITFEPRQLDEVTVRANELADHLHFEELAPMQQAVAAFGAVLVGDKIYAIGGDRSVKNGYVVTSVYDEYSDRMQIYDINTDQWTLSDLKFTKRAYHRIHYYNNKIFILGGGYISTNGYFQYLNKTVEIYDLQKNTITSSETNPHPALRFASALHNNQLFVMGGQIKKDKKKKTYSEKIHLLDLDTGYWYELENMLYPRKTTGICIDSLIYLIGGDDHYIRKFILSYNVLTGKNHVEMKLPGFMEQTTLAASGHIIYSYGSNDYSGELGTYNVLTKEQYDYKIDLKLHGSEMIYHKGKLYIMGGVYKTDKLIIPSKSLYCIDLKDLDKTKAHFVPNIYNKRKNEK